MDRPHSVAVGDLDGDRVPDLAVADAENVAILIGVGDGSFAPASFSGEGLKPSSLTIGDLNGDQLLDLVSAVGSNQVAVLTGNGDGSFAQGGFYGVGRYPAAVAIADLNGDETPDLAVANRVSNDVAVLLGARSRSDNR